VVDKAAAATGVEGRLIDEEVLAGVEASDSAGRALLVSLVATAAFFLPTERGTNMLLMGCGRQGCRVAKMVVVVVKSNRA
jgi:hypothetical protein